MDNRLDTQVLIVGGGPVGLTLAIDLAQRGIQVVVVRQSAVPGCRTPHLWLRDGRSLYDALGPEFTLLRFDPAVETGEFVAAAAERRVPLAVLDVESEEAASLYPRKLVLSRPDQHVAWRGDEPPKDPIGLVDRARGASFP